MADIPFEKFLHNKEILNIDVLEEYAKKHHGSIGHYQNNIYCPECGKALLVFTNESEDKNRRAYLSAKSVNDHKKGCPYRYPPTLKKDAIEHFNKYSVSQLNDKMNSIMRGLFSEKPSMKFEGTLDESEVLEHPLVINNKENKRPKTLRRKSLNRRVNKYDTSLEGDLFAFYAKDAKLNAVKHSGNNGDYYLLEIETENTKIEVFKSINRDYIREGEHYNIVCIGYLNKYHKIQLVDKGKEAIKYYLSG